MQTESRPRPAALAVLAYVLGFLAARHVNSPPTAVAGLVAVGVLACALRRDVAVRVGVLCLVTALGLATGGRLEHRRSVEQARLATLSPDVFSSVRIRIEDDWVRKIDGAWRLKARSFELIDGPQPAFEVRARLHVLLYDDLPPDVVPAQRLVAKGFLRRLDDGAYVLSVKTSSLVSVEGRASAADPRTWNRWLARRLEAAAEGSDTAGRGSALAQALVLGRGGLVSWEVIDLYQRGGTYHLLVFSGVQIAMMAAVVRWLLLRMKRRRAADAALILICVLMPRFVGADPSVSRSAMMIGLLLGCWLWERPTDAANLVFVSALVRLLLVPEDLTDPGFALTYSATAGILVIGRSLAENRSRLGRVVAYGLGADLGTTPFTLFFFNRATVGGSIVTLVVSPVVTAMLGLGFGATALAPFAPRACRALLEAIAWLNDVVMWVNRLVAEQARLSLVGASPSLGILGCALVAAVAASAGGSKGRNLLAAACLVVPIVSSIVNGVPDTSVEATVHVLDVGQGDATLVISRGRALLVDGGGSMSDPAFGTRTLLPLLAERRARRLDAVLLSHPHPDHCSGLVTALRDLEVGRLVLSRRHLATPCGVDLVDVAMRRRIPVEDAEAVTPFRLGEIDVEIFGTTHRYRRAWENNSSVLVRLDLGGRHVLLTGDIEREAEMVLLEQQPGRLRADVLKVPHHGSRSSTSSRFLDAVTPRIAFVSCGPRNRFGHPHPEPLAALEGVGSRVESTARRGNLEIRSVDGRLYVFRQFDSPR